MGESGTRSFKRWLTSLVARCVRRRRLTPHELLALRPGAILVVRQHNQMGDMVCATPALRAIRETWPAARITLVTAPVNVEVVRHNPDLDHALTFEQRMWRRPDRLLGFLGAVRGTGAELAIVLCSVSFSVTSAAIALASGARWVIGAESGPFGHDLSRHAFSLEMPAAPGLNAHAVAHSLAPLQAVGVTTADTSTVVVPASEERETAAQVLGDLDLVPGFWAVHPGAGKVQNVWPAANFAEVIGCALAGGSDVLMLHGPADAEALAAVLDLVDPGQGGKLRVAPAVSVGTAAALLEGADRFLCNDTGIMHVAGALGVPTVALFGPTDPALWKPPHARVVALRSATQTPDPRGEEFGWMENLEAGAVWRAWSGLAGRDREGD
ncbi:MAG: glycosyltransferase family 9 protein [bacterium]|nr:glycosyltransferase family 9 protein [bacterium]